MAGNMSILHKFVNAILIHSCKTVYITVLFDLFLPSTNGISTYLYIPNHMARNTSILHKCVNVILIHFCKTVSQYCLISSCLLKIVKAILHICMIPLCLVSTRIYLFYKYHRLMSTLSLLTEPMCSPFCIKCTLYLWDCPPTYIDCICCSASLNCRSQPPPPFSLSLSLFLSLSPCPPPPPPHAGHSDTSPHSDAQTFSSLCFWIPLAFSVLIQYSLLSPVIPFNSHSHCHLVFKTRWKWAGQTKQSSNFAHQTLYL